MFFSLCFWFVSSSSSFVFFVFFVFLLFFFFFFFYSSSSSSRGKNEKESQSASIDQSWVYTVNALTLCEAGSYEHFQSVRTTDCFLLVFASQRTFLTSQEHSQKCMKGAVKTTVVVCLFQRG